MTQQSNNKRIAKNTLMLYFRMILNMLVSLYTSRVVLNTLGIEDFGTYNIVGGVVTMFGFFNSSMASATQRFLAFEIGRDDKLQLRKVFSMSLNIHIVIAVLGLILAETIGLWFLNTKLTIPLERMEAARWIYQFSIFAFLIGVVSVPFNAVIIAHERMNIFAWVSIIEVCLKLIIVFMLLWLDFDKLKLYAVLIFLVSVIIFTIYFCYCRRNFNESKYIFNRESILFNRIFSHSGWMLFGTSTNMLSTQGVNILINIFFGVTVNAARGIAYQIQGVVSSFVNNFMLAVQPQIIKNYAQRNFKEMYKLVFLSSKYSFFMMFFLSLPMLLLTETIIQWWLKIVPDHVIVFTRLTIIDLFFITQNPSIASVSQASGKIKYYQLVIAIGFFLVFALTYLFFKLGFPSHYAFIIMIGISMLGLFARLLVLKIQLSFPIREYVKKVLIRIIMVISLSVPIPLFVLYTVDNITLQFISVCIVSVLSTITAVWFAGLENNERDYFKSRISIYFHKIIK